MQFMYAPGAEAHSPKVMNFLPELNTLHWLLLATLALRIGDSSACPQYEWNLIQYYVQKKRFSVFDYVLQEIISISRIALCSCCYAQQIMMMIEKVPEIEFLKDHEITDLKPQFPAAPIITKDVPSTSAPGLHVLIQLLLHRLLLPPLPPWVVFLRCSRVCSLGAVTLVSNKTCS
jgi:hypothetical protein